MKYNCNIVIGMCCVLRTYCYPKSTASVDVWIYGRPLRPTFSLSEIRILHCCDLVFTISITGFFDQKSAADMMKESEKMQGFEHPHVLSIIGVCVDAGPAPYIIMPFMANGSLLAYIKKEKMNLVVPTDASVDELASSYIHFSAHLNIYSIQCK